MDDNDQKNIFHKHAFTDTPVEKEEPKQVSPFATADKFTCFMIGLGFGGAIGVLAMDWVMHANHLLK
jgi:hypothetical protein